MMRIESLKGHLIFSENTSTVFGLNVKFKYKPMTTFQLIIAILATVYVVSSLYFAITGRILNKRQEKKNDEKFNKEMDFKDQVNVLTNRLGEVMTENTRLNGYLKSWIASANDWKQRYTSLLKEKEKIEKTLELERTPKRGGE